MKKIILTLIFIFSIFSLSNITNTNAEYNNRNNANDELRYDELLEKLNGLERKVYEDNLIQRVEFESEIIIPTTVDVKYIEYAYNLADTLELSKRMVFRLMHTESRFNDTIVSPRGAKGFMQLMPTTRSDYYALLHVDTLNLDYNQEDIYIGLNLLRDLYDYWRKRGNSERYSWKLALASYNSGKGTVIKYQGIPPIKETTDFVAFISKTHSNPDFYAKYIKKYEDSIKNGS
jgi:soluble lytic murein transglycosylase-like protein